MLKKSKFDYLLPKIFKFMRGDKTQKQMDLYMDFRPGTYHRLESDYLKPKLDLLINTVYQLEWGSRWESSLAEIASINKNHSSSLFLVSELVNIYGEPQKNTIEKDLGFSTTKWWRIKSGKSAISALDFFKLFEERTGKLSWFLENCFGEHFIQSLNETSGAYIDYTDLVIEDPTYTLITAFFDSHMNEGENRDALITKMSKVLNLEKSHIYYCLAKLEDLEICYFDTNRYICLKHKLEIRTELSLGAEIFSFIGHSIENSGEDSIKRKSYKIAAVSDKCIEQLIEEQRQFYLRVQNVLDSDKELKKNILILRSAIVSKTDK